MIFQVFENIYLDNFDTLYIVRILYMYVGCIYALSKLASVNEND